MLNAGSASYQAIYVWKPFTTMKRGQVLKVAAVGVGSTAVAASAIAQSTPELEWHMQSAFLQMLDTTDGGGAVIIKFVSHATGSKFHIKLFTADEIAGTFQIADAASNDTVETDHTYRTRTRMNEGRRALPPRGQDRSPP